MIVPAVGARELDDFTVIEDPEFVHPVGDRSDVTCREVAMARVCDE
jgi:hypothetical protein